MKLIQTAEVNSLRRKDREKGREEVEEEGSGEESESNRRAGSEASNGGMLREGLENAEYSAKYF